MSTRVLVLGLDAADADVLRKGADDGSFPALARLRATAQELSLDNELTTLPSGLWGEIASGRSSGKTGFYFPPRQLRTGEAVPRPVQEDEIDPTAFWTLASDASARVAVVDYPSYPMRPGLNGIQLAEWGTHDRPFGRDGLAYSDPAELAAEITERYGAYSLTQSGVIGSATRAPCDQQDGSAEGCERLLVDLLAGIEVKTRLLVDLLERDEWDLFVTVFGEPQCVGHQMWHLRPGNGEAGTPSDPVHQVYAALDRACGEIIEAAGASATTVLIASHGMAAPTGGSQLMPEVLVRLGLGSGRGKAASARSRLPAPVKKLARLVLRGGLQQRAREAAGTLAHPLESAGTLAAALDGDRCSFIRINVEGREPLGSVSPARAAELVEEIRAELRELVDPKTGEPIVASAVTGREAFGPDVHPDVPDLMVSFREDLGLIEACESARVGRIDAPYRLVRNRTGVHPNSPTTVWCVGAATDTLAARGTVRDLAPTVLELLGIDPGDAGLDGRSLVRSQRVA